MEPQVVPTALEMSLLGAGAVFGIIGFVLGIIVAIKMIQNNQTALGIISIVLMLCSGIGHLIALIYGWMKSAEWNMKNLMTAYTVCFILSIVCGGAGYAMFLPRLLKATMEEIEQQGEDVEMEEGNWDPDNFRVEEPAEPAMAD